MVVSNRGMQIDHKASYVILNRAQNQSEPYSDKEILLRRALKPFPSQMGSEMRAHRILALLQLGTIHETMLGYSLILTS